MWEIASDTGDFSSRVCSHAAEKNFGFVPLDGKHRPFDKLRNRFRLFQELLHIIINFQFYFVVHLAIICSGIVTAFFTCCRAQIK